jgi:hypothetical protein
MATPPADLAALAEAFTSIANHLEMPDASYPEETRVKLLAANKQASDKAVDTLDGRSFADNIKATRLSLTSLGHDYFSPSIASWLGFFSKANLCLASTASSLF